MGESPDWTCFPVKFLMDTPIGRLWVNVKGFYGQELQLHIGSMYEVPLEFRKMDLKARSLERALARP